MRVVARVLEFPTVAVMLLSEADMAAAVVGRPGTRARPATGRMVNR